MFIVELDYIKPISEIEKELTSHRLFLDKYFSSGLFVASGPKIPRDGGIILVRDTERKKLEKILSEDPFHLKNLANYKVVEVEFNKKSQIPFI